MFFKIFTGGVTYIDHGSPDYKFDDMWILGNSHVAVLTNTTSEVGTLNVTNLWGDRSGVLHIGRRQHYKFADFNNYLPVNLMAYKYV